jgi:hypothetical protein
LGIDLHFIHSSGGEIFTNWTLDKNLGLEDYEERV